MKILSKTPPIETARGLMLLLVLSSFAVWGTDTGPASAAGKKSEPIPMDQLGAVAGRDLYAGGRVHDDGRGATEAPGEVTAAARKGLPAFLALIPPGSKSSYGFADDSDLTQAHLESPSLLHTIQPIALLNDGVSNSVSAVISETTMWFFPVSMGNEMKAMLVVDQQDGTWKAVSLGYAHLAREWSQVLQQWPEARGYHPKLIAVFPAKLHLFTVPEVDDRNLTAILPPENLQGTRNAAAVRRERDPMRYFTLGSLASEAGKLKSILNEGKQSPTLGSKP